MFLKLLNRPIVIEEPALADVDGLAEIHAASFARGWSGEEFAALLSDDTVLGFVARRGGPGTSRRPVGFVLVRRAADEAEILSIALQSQYRRRGIGRRLMEAVMRKLYEDRFAALFLEVEAGNAAAIALYKKLGFKAVGERKGYYRARDGAATTALVMRLNLR